MADRNVIAIIPAKEHSRRCPGKNFRDFCGLPLYLWSVRQAKNNPLIDTVVVSTDRDRDDIDEETWSAGVDLVIDRPPILATDAATTADVCLHAAWECNRSSGLVPDTIVLLQPTSPLRTQAQITRCVAGGQDYTVGRNGQPDGAVYTTSYEQLRSSRSFFRGLSIMYWEVCVDIDTPEDFEEAEEIMRSRMDGKSLHEYLQSV